jgi:Planctomycete cytochrome C
MVWLNFLSMTDALLQLLQHLPIGLLIAAVLLDAFIVKKNRREVEPAVLWLLFCAVTAFGVLLLVKAAQYLSSGDREKLMDGLWAGGISAVAALGWAFKRQGRNLGVLILRERFFGPNPTDPPLPKPGQGFWILGWRFCALLSLGGALAFALMRHQPGAGKVMIAEEKPAASEPAPATPVAAANPAAPAAAEAPAAAPATAPASEATAPAAAVVKDPTKDLLAPEEESNAAAQMATAAASPAEGTPAAPAPAATPVITAPPAEPVRPVSRNSAYFSKVRPILARACIKCHGADKQKGDLALHNPDAIRAGINGKPCIVPGDPDSSRIYKCIILPPDDPDFMPQKGQPLSATDKKTLFDWIKAGADLGDGVSIPGGGGGTLVVDIISTNLPEPDPKIVESLTREHVIVRPLSKNKRVLELDFSHSDRAYKELKLEELAPIALNIYKIDLSRTKVKDADLSHLSGMKNLSQLILSRTEITDAALAHLSGNHALEVINLYSTQVGDAGLAHLQSLKALKKVFLWQSKATAAGAQTLTAAIPGISVSLGSQ